MPNQTLPVGQASPMPGTEGFTMACFKASDVPAGTNLYTLAPMAEDPDINLIARVFADFREEACIHGSDRVDGAFIKAARRLIGAADASALTVWSGPMPESNGKSNFTAILHRGDLCKGHTIDRSEYPDRVRYEADRVRWLIGEIDKEPWILDYDADKHSGYVPRYAEPTLYSYVYEWDYSPGVVHRSFDCAPYNGRQPDRTIEVFRAPKEKP